MSFGQATARTMPAEIAARRTLLVVDDEDVQRMHIRAVAGNAGFDVDEAPSMQEAIRLVAEKDYDVVTVDLSLGDRDGVEVIRDIARSGKRPDVVVVSGREDRIRDAVVRFGRAAGLSVIGEFKKPVRAAEFKQCLAAATLQAERKAERESAMSIPPEDVRAAIAAGDIRPVYQPQVAMETGEIVGVEALARWISSVHGAVPPEVFVEIAEKNGFAKDLARLMLERVVADAAPWCVRQPELRVAVNVSAAVLSDLAFPEEVMAALKAVEMRPDNLVIEVTESTALSDIVNNADVMSRLCIKGVALSLDDFGTGYGSLKTLQAYPGFEEIKIDRGFVADAHRDPNAWTIVQATIALAKARSMRIVAEGIETEVVAGLLRDGGVDCGQGYLYGRPMVAAEFGLRLPV